MKKILNIFILLLMIISIPNIVRANYVPDKQHSSIKKGDTIYFDTTGLNWDKVYIHLWEKNGAVYKEWSNDDEMTKVSGTDNIYMFTAPDDISETYNMLIFKNGISGSENQTISLGYVEGNYAYIINGTSSGKRLGYWYLYDKNNLEEKLDNIKIYQTDKKYYTSTSYSNLDELISNIETALNSEIKLESAGGNPEKFYIQVDYTIDEANTIINALEVNTSLLSDLIDQEEGKYNDYEKDYTKNSLDNLKEVINANKGVLNGTSITVDDIKNGINDINEAKNSLVNQADKIELREQLDEISNLDENKYTEDSYKELKDLLDDAKELKDNTNATQNEVDKMVEKLKNARNNLKEKINSEENTNTNESKNQVEAPKTYDSIIKIIAVLGISVVGLILTLILIFRKKKTINN